LSKVLITGATGQIGSNLAEYMTRKKELGISSAADIICLVRSPKVAEHLTRLGVTIVSGDLSDAENLKAIFVKHEIQYVFHIAAMVDPTATLEQLYAPNVTGTLNMIEAFINSKAKTFVYTSSISVYDDYTGDKGTREFDETMPIGPLEDRLDPYSATKRIAETKILEYAKNYPDKTFIITRPAVVVGSRDRITLPTFVKVVSMKGIPKLIEGGKDKIAFTPAEDVARALLFLAGVGHKISGEIYNITGDPATYKEIFTHIANYYNVRPPHISIPLWLFRVLTPCLKFMRLFVPKNQSLKTFVSPTALSFIGRSLTFKNDKLKALGFKLTITAEETILAGLKQSDPDKKVIKADKKYQKQ
jgi:nucleoside-diphosphate-sugar epimerase